MAARNFAIAAAANEEHWKCAECDRFFRRDIFKEKTSLSLRDEHRHERSGAKKSFSEKFTLLKTSVVEGNFAEISEGALSDDSVDAELQRCRLQRDCRTHR